MHPEIPVVNDGDQVCHAEHHPAQPVRPPHHEAGPWAQDIGGKVLEGLVFKIVEQQLPHCAHHEEQHESHHGVDDHDGGARYVDGAARAHKQPSSDCSTNGDQLDVTVT